MDHEDEGEINIEETKTKMQEISYMVLEYISGVPFNKLRKDVGALGEQVAHYFMK